MRAAASLIACIMLACWTSGGLARSPQMDVAKTAAAPTAKAGIQRIGDDALFYRPATQAKGERPLLVLLHGAGMSARSMIDGARAEADRCGCLLLSVQSKGATWDTIGLVRAAGRAERATPAQLFGDDVQSV